MAYIELYIQRPDSANFSSRELVAGALGCFGRRKSNVVVLYFMHMHLLMLHHYIITVFRPHKTIAMTMCLLYQMCLHGAI